MQFLLIEPVFAAQFSSQPERLLHWIQEMGKAFSEALRPEAFVLPESLRETIPFEIRRADGDCLIFRHLIFAELPREYTHPGYGDEASAARIDPNVRIVAVTHVLAGNAASGRFPYQRSRYFYLRPCFSALRRRDISFIAEGFRPGSTSLVSGRAREPDALSGAPDQVIGDIIVHYPMPWSQDVVANDT